MPKPNDIEAVDTVPIRRARAGGGLDGPRFQEVAVSGAVGIVSSLVAAGIVFAFTHADVTTIALAASTVINVTSLFYLAISRAKGSPATNVPSVAALGIVGANVHESQKLLITDIVPSVKKSLWFWGVSAKRTLATPVVQQLIREGYHRGISFRFLLFDPESEYLERKAKEEFDDPGAWRTEIGATLARLKALADEVQTEVAVRTYTDFPIWRCVFVDGDYVYLHYYPVGKQGPQSPQLVLRKQDGSFFEAIEKEFNETWEHRSKPLS